MKRIVMTLLLLSALTGCSGAGAAVNPPTPISTSEPGGSSYIFTDLSNESCTGVIRNYATNPAKANLAKIYASGQRRLSIQLNFLHEDALCSPATGHPDNPLAIGYPMASGHVDQEYLQNFQQYVLDAHALGFQEFVVIFGPEWNNDAISHGAWTSLAWGMGSNPDGIDYYHENLNTIRLIRGILVQLGVPYRLVLQDEAFHIPEDMAVAEAYITQLWHDYASQFGTADTCGVTVSGPWPDPQHEAKQIDTLMSIVDAAGFGRPSFWCVNGDSTSFAKVSNELRAKGAIVDPIVITSTTQNDLNNARAMRTASNATGRQILFLMQWPSVDASMSGFSNYHAYGF